MFSLRLACSRHNLGKSVFILVLFLSLIYAAHIPIPFHPAANLSAVIVPPPNPPGQYAYCYEPYDPRRNQITLAECRVVLSVVRTRWGPYPFDQKHGWAFTKHSKNPIMAWEPPLMPQNPCRVFLYASLLPGETRLDARFSIQDVWSAATTVAQMCAENRKSGSSNILGTRSFKVGVVHRKMQPWYLWDGEAGAKEEEGEGKVVANVTTTYDGNKSE